MKRRTFIKMAALGALAGVTTAGYSFKIEPERLVTEHVSIAIPNLAEPLQNLSIVQLSDLHLYPYTQPEQISKAVARANTLEPDLIVLTGDYVLSHIDAILELAPILATLQARYGIFAVYGNHDLKFPYSRQIMREGFRKAGIALLENQGVTLDIKGAACHIAGVDDGWFGKRDIAASMQGCPADAMVLLLMHEPDFADEYALALQNSQGLQNSQSLQNSQGGQGRQVLQLSGHSHGGQVRLPLLGAPILPPDGRKYPMGLFHLNSNFRLYVNRGIGSMAAFPNTPAVRFNCPPELSSIRLIKENTNLSAN